MLLSLLLPVAPPATVPELHLLAQTLVTPNADAVGTVVQQQSTAAGTQLTIEGGTPSGTNLFHSFEQFTLEAGDTANFVAQPGIDNILGRVNGGKVSELDGTLGISGGTANLFLMNPAGIVFGPNARLNLPAAFTATTGDGIGFGSDIFRAFGTHDFSQFEGSPDSILFSATATGSIISSGHLSLGANQLLRLVGSSVISSGQLTAGQVQVVGTASTSGSSQVTFAQDGLVLNLGLNSESLQPLEAETLADIRVQGAGNVAVQSVTAQSASLTAANHLLLEASQLRTKGDLTLAAGNVLKGYDTSANPFILQSGGNLRIQGNNGIDIFALNHPQTQIQSGGDLSLISNDLISGDALR